MPFKAINLFLLIACFSYPGMAQYTHGTISGVIKDYNNTVLDGATVVLLKLPDSTVKQTIAARAGKFTFKNLVAGNYQIKSSFTGHTHYTSPALTIDPHHTDLVLPVIVLEPDRKQTLPQVLVNTRKKLVEHKIDRTIINVESMISAAGSNALDVLARSPGVSVDVNGDINLYGKGGVLVLIDDRPTYLSVQDLAAYLRSLPSELLDKVELMSSPPARYDASGSAVINIVLKKIRSAGFNGTAGAWYNQGMYARTGSSANLNYRTRAINLFGNFSYSEDRNLNQDTYNRYYYTPDHFPVSSLAIDSRFRYRSAGWNLRTGIDYFISPQTTLGMLLTGNIRPKKDRLDYNSLQYAGNGQLDSMSNGRTDGDYRMNSTGVNLNLQHKLDSSGTMLTADLDYVSYKNDGNQLATNIATRPDGSLTSEQFIQSSLPSNIHIYSAKADYSQRLSNQIRYDLGLKTSFVTTNNDVAWFNRQGTILAPDYTKTNHFIYRENINAFYINATKEWKWWGLQAGLRVENTNTKGMQEGNLLVRPTSFRRNYTELFPTLHLSYKLDSAGDNVLRFVYQRRIRRPNYQQLNPFLTYRDRFSYAAGNPDLHPHFNNFVEFQFHHKSLFGFTILYGRINNLIQSLTQSKGDTILIQPENFGTNYSINFRPYVSISPLKGWDLNGIILAFYLINKGNAFGQYINNKVLTFETELNNQFRFGQGWSAEVNAFWGSQHKGGQSIARGGWSVNAGLQKTVLRGQGTIRMKLDDVFYSKIRRDTTIGLANALIVHRGTADSRIVGISFNYRFGKAANARKRNHNSGGAVDEQGRAN